MQRSDFTESAPGELVDITSRFGTPALSFVPATLPPHFDLDVEISKAAERAALAIGNLNGSGSMLPNPTLLFQPFLRREALASSRIEGTRAEFGQLVLFEADEHATPDADIQEVQNYLLALHTGWHKPVERPFTPGFIAELHQQLLQGVRGSSMNPGRIRMVQVHIGDEGGDLSTARFVPPPPELVRELLENLCDYIEHADDLPFVVRLAVIHYQFETIHPFMDGNGRLGRLIMPLLLGMWGYLDMPLLYLSEYFEDNREKYMDHLLAVSQRGEWKDWILFTLRGIEQQSRDAMIRGRYLLNLREQLRSRYIQARNASTILQIIDGLFEHPATSRKRAAELAGVSPQAVSKSLERLVDDGVLEEVTGNVRYRIYAAPEIIAAMSARTPSDAHDR